MAEAKTTGSERYIGKGWLVNYEADLRESISPDDSRSRAWVNLWTGLAHLACDETLPEQLRGYFSTIAGSINDFGHNAHNKNGTIINFPKFNIGGINQTVGQSFAEHDIPQTPIQG